MIQDILQTQPETTNIVVVLGASALERFWANECRREFQPFTNQVGFRWLNDLPLDQIVARCAALPPHSFILHGMFVVDAAGVSCEQSQALRRLHAVANAPLFSYFGSEFGLGPIGGRLYQDSEVGVQAARTAVRLLRGEKPGNIPPQVLGDGVPVFDWRELQRWSIPEARLPAGSVLQFCEPSPWVRYRWPIAGGVALCLFQSALVIGLFANALARKRADLALRQSEERFRLLIEQAPEAIVVLDPEQNRLVEANAQAELLFGCGRQELLTSSPQQFYAPEQPGGEPIGESMRDHTLRALRGETVVFERTICNAQGQRCRCDVRLVRLPARPRELVRASFIDITERSRAEDQVRQLSFAVEQSPVLVVITDPAGSITYVNRKFSEVTGYSFAECLGQNPRLLKSGECPASTYQKLWACLTTGGTWRGEFHNRKKSGELYWERAVISPLLDSTGKVTRFVGVKEDITERKQAEEAVRDFGARLIRSQEEERSRLARELHDDITQRLARLAIDVGRSEAGGRGVLPPGTARAVREELVQLSEDVHTLSYRLHPSILEDLGLAPALRAEAEHGMRAGRVPIEVKVRDLPETIPPEVALCVFRVGQEALRNALRHARARALTLSLRGADGGLQLAVQDDGCGFDPQSPRARPSLGLASMRERVRLLGGELDLESAPGQGTTVLAWVPLGKAKG